MLTNALWKKAALTSTPNDLPRVAQRSSAGIRLRAFGEFAIEFGEQSPLRREEQLSAGGGEHRVGGDRRAIDGEASTGQRFKSGAQRWIADEIMRPGEPAKQNEGLAADNRQVVETRAKLAAHVSRVHCGAGKPQAAAARVALAIGRGVEILELNGTVRRHCKRRQHGVAVAAFQPRTVALPDEIRRKLIAQGRAA